MNIETGYECKECGAAVELHGGVIVRSCQHKGTVLMSMDATVSQDGKVTAGTESAADKLARLFNDLVKLFTDGKPSTASGN